MIELTDVELFKDLTCIELDGILQDLHNDYDCTGLNYNGESKSLNIIFEKVDNIPSPDRLCLTFKDAAIVKFDLFLIRTEDASTINSFYRGKFERNGELFEYSSLNERYFYIEFEKGDKFEIFSKKVLLVEI